MAAPIIMFLALVIAVCMVTLMHIRDVHRAERLSRELLCREYDRMNKQLSDQVARLKAQLDDRGLAEPVTADDMAYVMTSLGVQTPVPSSSHELVDQILADLDALGGSDAGL